VRATGAIGPYRSLVGIQDAIRVDEPLEPRAEATVGRADHHLRAGLGPRSQAANASPDAGFIAHTRE
jgi:hypothetical protein